MAAAAAGGLLFLSCSSLAVAAVGAITADADAAAVAAIADAAAVITAVDAEHNNKQ